MIAVDETTEKVLKHDRLIVIGGLVAITVLAWIYLLTLTTPMNDMGRGMSEMAHLRAWTTGETALMFTMWVVMMIGMMVPSATPLVLLYARVCRKQANRGQPFAPTTVFFMGYIVLWVVFSLALTSAQWGLEQAALLSPMMASTSPLLGGVVLIAAGVYQWLPYKHICLKHCRSPIAFLSSRWKPGLKGALLMGLEHGCYCLGCCWAVMILLFVGGVMNLLWVAAIAIFILAEKVALFGRLVSRAGAILFVVMGAAVIIRG